MYDNSIYKINFMTNIYLDRRAPMTNDGPQMTDDEDSNSRDVQSAEQD
jgi:hypothetical protein